MELYIDVDGTDIIADNGESQNVLPNQIRVVIEFEGEEDHVVHIDDLIDAYIEKINRNKCVQQS